MSKQAMKRVRRKMGLQVCRAPLDSFAFPGGYPIVYVCEDGGIICPDCANENILKIDGANRGRNKRGNWSVESFIVHYEGAPFECDECHKQIDSAYGSQEWRDSGEGPFDNEEIATDFAEAECGVEWRVREVGGLWRVETRSGYGK